MKDKGNPTKILLKIGILISFCIQMPIFVERKNSVKEIESLQLRRTILLKNG